MAFLPSRKKKTPAHKPLTARQKKALAKKRALAKQRALAKKRAAAKKKQQAAAKKPTVTKTVPGPSPLPSAPTVPVEDPSPASLPDIPAPPTLPPVAETHVDGPGVPVHSGPFGAAQATRLLWRAGFGPKPGEAAALGARSLADAVRSLTRPTGEAVLVGPEPHTQSGSALAPEDLWGHDHLWWLDRMVRSDQPLVERMTLVWHDWFATSNDGVGNQTLMLAQNATLRANALGNFPDLAQAITRDPAMLVFLNGIDNRKGSPNENYARELMELFTLGADRDAYTETDVRELARALTGWRADWNQDAGRLENFRFDPNRHDARSKTVFGQTGNWNWDAAVPLTVANPLHRSFFVRKLWSYFIPSAPDAATQAGLEAVYVNSGYGIRDVVEAILMHPDLYQGAPMVKNPAVFTAGLLRTVGQGIDTDWWYWRMDAAGQQLFMPPNVSGWNDNAWLDTSTLQARWNIVYDVLNARYVPVNNTYSTTETPLEAVVSAQAFWGNPPMTDETRTALLAFATAAVPATAPTWDRANLRAQRQNALRHLIANSPDLQVS
ncbi:MAG: hypothetical protein JWM73_149 [Solirubrobacterales bacterium]|nr:hypothetical protein [Solirubrobacterales bacterium]